ncbi:glycosyl transferase family 2 [Gloeocapsa sp. PCC 7428]|uniref:glycosyltransferase family 2 protein n=1 Tax=Gloeocapsa sp. PCC 7428 TaxID=1173026 RepID=UPI0002A60DAA|nr:glycosyltransferase family 2 protein [Gloeocapsa sp. PCC 7428]AFZ29471.1 glycosyl transferase family 2 [Gloeocapsa sp. PCC 7428]
MSLHGNNQIGQNQSSSQVSIVIPTKNRYLLLLETIESIRRQTYANWETLVVDDGSTDETAAQMLALSKQEPRIRFIRRTQGNAGAPASRNVGVSHATGDYIIFLDSDDCLAPHCLEKRVAIMDNHPDLDFGVFACQVFCDRPGDRALLWNRETQDQENDLDRFLSLDVPWQTTSPIWKKEALQRLGSWDESLIIWQDWEFHLRALVKGLKYKRFAQLDCFWRMPVKERDSIGKKGITAEYLLSNEQLIADVYAMLSKAQLLNSYRRYLVAGLYFWLATQWSTYVKSTSEAVRVWSICREKNLVNDLEYWEGLVYFKVRRTRYIRRLAREYLSFRWPAYLMRQRHPVTLQNTPMSTQLA